MAKVVIEKLICDRCGAELPKRREPGSTIYTVTVSVDYGTAGGRMIAWADMCGACNATVAAELRSMKASADSARIALIATGGEHE